MFRPSRFPRAMRGAAVAVVLMLGFVIAGCRATPGAGAEPDRTEAFRDCTVAWTLVSTQDDAGSAAMDVAQQALSSATVSEEDQSKWEETIRATESESAAIGEDELPAFAFAEAIREGVRNELATAGYPDTERAVEIYSEVSCGG